MPFWLHKLLFGCVKVEYLVSCASGRTFVGSVELATRRSDYNFVREQVIAHARQPGELIVFVQSDIRGTSEGLLDDFPRLSKLLQPS